MLSSIRPFERNGIFRVAKRSASRQVDSPPRPSQREAADATRFVEEAVREAKPDLGIRRYPAGPINEVFRAARSSRSLDRARALNPAVPSEHDAQRSQPLSRRPWQRSPPTFRYSRSEPSQAAPLQQGQRTGLRRAALSAWASPPRPHPSDSLSSRVGHIQKVDRYCWSLTGPFRMVEQGLAMVIAYGNRVPGLKEGDMMALLQQDYIHFRLGREQVARQFRTRIGEHVDPTMHRVNVQGDLYAPVKVCIPLMNDTYKCLYDLQGSEVQKRFPQLFDPDKAQQALDTLTDMKDLLQSYGSWHLRRKDPRAFAYQTFFNVDLMEGITRVRGLVLDIQRVLMGLRNRAVARDLAAVREKLKTWQAQYTSLYFALQPVTSIRLETMDPEELDRRVAIEDGRLARYNSQRQQRIGRRARAGSAGAVDGRLDDEGSEDGDDDQFR